MKLARSLFAIIPLVLALALVAGACNQESPPAQPPVDEAQDVEVSAPEPATEEPEPTATVVLVALEGATLEVALEPVEMRAPGDDEMAAATSEEAFEVGEDTQVAVGAKGVGFITWPEFLRGELLTAADVTVTEINADQRTVTLRQDAGTARYTLLDPDSPADVTVEAGEMTLHLGGSPADVIVSHGPEGYESVWAVVVSGGADVDSPVAQDGDGQEPASVELTEGHVVAQVADAGLSKALPVDLVEVELWYGDIASGDLKRTIAEVAFRCEVIADKVGLMAYVDDTVSQIGRLSKGAIVDALGRNYAGDWVLISTISPVAEGWVPDEALACAGPTAALLLAENELDLAAPGALALLEEAAEEGVLPPSALATPTPLPSGDSGDSSKDSDDKPKPPPRVEPTDDPDVPTECVGPECDPPTPMPEPTRRPRPTAKPTEPPDDKPTPKPTAKPKPTQDPDPDPTDRPDPTDTPEPTATPSPDVTGEPTGTATATPTSTPTATSTPTSELPEPTEVPTEEPTEAPTEDPTDVPTEPAPPPTPTP